MNNDVAKLMAEALRGTQGQAQMPFPDNHNPDMDFVNRFPNLPPSGIMNDLKPSVEFGPPLIRRLPSG